MILLLAISFGPVEGSKFGLLFTNSENMRTFAHGFLRPDFTDWRNYVAQMWLTVQIALWGTAIAVVIAIPFGLACSRNVAPVWVQQPMRLLMNVLRSVPDLVMGTVFIVAVGLGPFAGVMALALNTGGVLAKLFSEGVESIDPRPVEGIRATGGARLHEIVWGVLPQVSPLWTSYALYRFESNARSATILGLIGAGGIGQLLFEVDQRLPVSAGRRHRDRHRRGGDADRPLEPGAAGAAAVAPTLHLGVGAPRRRLICGGCRRTVMQPS